MGRAIAFLVATGLLGAHTVPIRSQEIQRAKQLLGSPVIEDRAWGAYLASRLHAPELDSLLLDQFQSAAAFRDYPYSSNEHAFLTVMLDAAIEADLKVPTALLDPLKETSTDSVMILLSRNSDSEDLLIQLRTNQRRDVVWLAANNLLLGKKSQAWFAAMLGEIRISHQFVITDGVFRPGSGVTGGSGHCGDGVVSMPAGFPPAAAYDLEDKARPGNVLFAPGPQNVYFRKTLVPSEKQVGSGTCSGTLDRPTLDIDYLARLAGKPALQSERLFRADTRLVFSGDPSHQIDNALEGQAAGIREFIQMTEQQNDLRASGVHLTIVPEVDDARGNTTEPLPHPAPLEFVLN